MSRPRRFGGRRIALAGALLLPLATAAAVESDPATAVIARADGVTLTVGDITGRLASLQPAQRQALLADPGKVESLIESELGRRLLLAAAHREHWERRSAVAAAIRDATAEILIGSYLSAHAPLAPGFPSEAEARHVYEADLKRFMRPRQYRLAQIFIALPERADAAAVTASAARARGIAAKASQPGADFAALARTESDDHASAAAGGDLGWLDESALIPAVQVAVQGLSEGSVSDPVAASDGWHIVREIATRPAAPRPFAEVRPAIEAALRRQQQQQAAERFVGSLLARSNAAINAPALSRLVGASR